MELKTIRGKTGLNEKQFVAKLKPFLQKRRTVLTEGMLARIENGGSVSADRVTAIEESIKEAFPDFSDQTITVCPKRPRLAISSNLLTLIVFLLLSVGACAVYYFASEKAIVSDTISIVASVAGVVALVYTIRKLSS